MSADWRDEETRIIAFPSASDPERDPEIVVARTIIAFAMHQLPPEKQERIIPWFRSMFGGPRGDAS